GHATAQRAIGHHGLKLASEPAFGLVSIRTHSAKLCVGFIYENDHFRQREQDATQSFENHIRLSKPLTSDVLQNEHDHVQFSRDSFEQVRFPSPNRAADGSARQCIGTARRYPWHEFVPQKFFEAGEADAVIKPMCGFLELDNIFAQLALDEL